MSSKSMHLTSRRYLKEPEYWTMTIYKVPENADFVPVASSSLPGGVRIGFGGQCF